MNDRLNLSAKYSFLQIFFVDGWILRLGGERFARRFIVATSAIITECCLWRNSYV